MIHRVGGLEAVSYTHLDVYKRQIVPYTRGAEVSRPLEDVLVEIIGLAEQGVKEITLLGQNVNAYRGAMAGGEIADFALLIETVADIPGIERIRFVTSHPKEFTQRLIDVYERVPQLVSHLYLPAQHGSDRILCLLYTSHQKFQKLEFGIAHLDVTAVNIDLTAFRVERDTSRTQKAFRPVRHLSDVYKRQAFGIAFLVWILYTLVVNGVGALNWALFSETTPPPGEDGGLSLIHICLLYSSS